MAWATFAFAVLVGVGWLLAPTPDPSRTLTGRWVTEITDERGPVRYEVGLYWPGEGVWDQITPAGHRQWTFRYRGHGYDYCAALPWDQSQCLPMRRHGDTLTIGSWRFAPYIASP